MEEQIIHKVSFTGQFRQCPECGYNDGFHTMLKENSGSISWLFICPSCHEVFDIGCRLPDLIQQNISTR
jgi:uncharacterized Zn finger protein